MSGYDSSFHLAEECSNASLASPRAIVMTSGVGGVLGWAFQMAISYTVVDVLAVLEADQPFIGYLAQCLDQKYVDLIASLTIISAFFMGQASMIAASRVAYAYARDGCFPASFLFAKVNTITQTPVNAVWLNNTLGCLILLLIFGGGVVIDAIFSVGAIAAYVAFIIPIVMKVFFVRDNFKPGPWHLGKYSRPIGFVSTAFVVLMVPILCFPQYRGSNLTPDGMNWTVLVYFGPMFFAVGWYFIYAHKFFKGPKVNVAHMIHATTTGDYGSVIEGVDTGAPSSPPDSISKKID